MSIGDILKEEGLAISPRVVGPVQESSDGQEHTNHEVIPVVQCSNKGIDGDEQPDTEENVFQWLGPSLPSSCEFSCQVAHLDWDCNLHVSTMSGNQENLRHIQSVLQARYAGSGHSQEDLSWKQGEACIAMFSLDKRWYRGLVMKVLDTGDCEVKFVDYGSQELCQPGYLRKKLLCTEIPIQCFTVNMNILPVTEKWSKEVLDLLHETLVDQELDVSVTEDKDTFPLSVKVSTKSGLDIAEFLVQQGFARVD